MSLWPSRQFMHVLSAMVAWMSLVCAVIFAEHLVSHQPLHCGHKAAFVERLDVGVHSSSGGENHRLIPFAHSISHMRNRAYAPGIGRFLQPDPNATAAVLLEASSYHGRGIGATLAAFSMEEMYGDGMNPYEYLGSNPVNRSGPMGLSWDPFSAVDDYLAESSGSTAAFMERITGGMQVAAYVGAVVASMLPFPITAIAADLGAGYLENGGGIPPQLVEARKLLGYANLAVIGAFVGKMAYSATKTAIKYLMTHGLRGTVKNLIAAGKGFASKAWNWLKRKEHVPGGCGCFVAATLVWTASGLMPISEIRIGDEVFAEDEATREIDLRVVTDTIVVNQAALLRIDVRDSAGRVETIETTDEHPFMVDGVGWRRADELRPGDSLRTLSGSASVELISYDSRRVPVYNLSVEGLPNYHVGGDGVLVHNCYPSRVLQTNGRVFLDGTAEALNREHGLDLPARDWGRALERLKESMGRGPAEHNHKIHLDGVVTDKDTGVVLGNLLEHL